jgi:ethanolamine utilization protein EutP (predicted NTPase)
MVKGKINLISNSKNNNPFQRKTRAVGYEEKFKSKVNFFTSPNTTYNKLRSKERNPENREEQVPMVSSKQTFKSNRRFDK